MQNSEIRELAKEKNVRLWQIANALGITDATFSRKLRKEFTEEEKKKVYQIIQSIHDKKAVAK